MPTGESVPAEKTVAPAAADAALGDRRSMAFSGTLVTAGQGSGVVVATGVATELGRISRLLGQVERLETPLIRQMNVFARQLTFIILGLSVATFAFAVWVRGYALDEAFMAIVGMAVAAIPEGLPAVLTVTLAIGVQRMAARNAIIRRCRRSRRSARCRRSARTRPDADAQRDDGDLGRHRRAPV
ncbi:MAG: hypothetical protein R3D02_11435 [Hyphomicrobiales bacterium]